MSVQIERENHIDELKSSITSLKNDLEVLTKELNKTKKELYRISEENDFLEFMSIRNNTVNTQTNNIERVVISDFCLRSYPCQHDCEIYYNDGSMEKIRRTGRYIARNYFDILNNKDKMHFYIYLK